MKEQNATITKSFDELPDDWTCVICGVTKKEYEEGLAADSHEDDGPVTEDDLVAEIVTLYPDAIEVLRSAGMHCIGCAAARGETLRDACLVHGLKATEMVKAINHAING